jgi:hypothetical protein
MIKNIMLILIVALLLIGCATCSESQDIQKNLQAHVGTLTYDEALSNWGERLSVFQGDDVFVVTWGAEKSGAVIFPIGNILYSGTVEDGWKLIATFNKSSRRMTSVKYNQW